jgi:16S rRNA (guanine527-N7)-methyltransferase
MTALGSAAAVVRELLIDSLLFLPLLPLPRPLALVDIGAGAGIPGIPLRLADPAIGVTFIEARRKRVSFLLAVKRELDLHNVTVKEGRAEALLDQEPDLVGAFDVAVTRAVGPPEALLPTALKYLKAGGLFLVTGPPTPLPHERFEQIRVVTPGTSKRRVFLKAVKGS